MNLETILAFILDVTGNFNPRIAIVLFLICGIGELGFSIPYLLETIWLLSGYHLAVGVLSYFDLFLFWLIAQIGRQAGSTALYFLGILGSGTVTKFYKRFLESRLAGRVSLPHRILRLVSGLSPFPVALGRLVGLRIPFTLTLSARRRWRVLSQGVLISSVVWDGIYIVLGNIVGATVVLNPVSMILYSLAGLTALYIVTFLVRLARMPFSKKGAE